MRYEISVIISVFLGILIQIFIGLLSFYTEENKISSDFIKEFRRDIVKINPVIKTNCKGDNIIGHSAPYPSKIPELAIRYYSGVNDIVLDPFMGSGTTAKMAMLNNRHYIGFEFNKEYYEKSI